MFFFIIYGIRPLPTSYDALITAFYNLRQQSANVDEQCIWHFILSFDISPSKITFAHFQLTDAIARIFSLEYPICYSLHYDKEHLHCHYILSTTSALSEGAPLETAELNQCFVKIQALVQAHGFTLTIDDKGGFLNVR